MIAFIKNWWTRRKIKTVGKVMGSEMQLLADIEPSPPPKGQTLLEIFTEAHQPENVAKRHIQQLFEESNAQEKSCHHDRQLVGENGLRS